MTVREFGPSIGRKQLHKFFIEEMPPHATLAFVHRNNNYGWLSLREAALFMELSGDLVGLVFDRIVYSGPTEWERSEFGAWKGRTEDLLQGFSTIKEMHIGYLAICQFASEQRERKPFNDLQSALEYINFSEVEQVLSSYITRPMRKKQYFPNGDSTNQLKLPLENL